jgi:hypothetical protein
MLIGCLVDAPVMWSKEKRPCCVACWQIQMMFVGGTDRVSPLVAGLKNFASLK